jgi:hypothetical protein
MRSADIVGWLTSQVAASNSFLGPNAGPLSKRRHGTSPRSFTHAFILSTIGPAMKYVLHWSTGVVQRCEIDPMPGSDRLDLRDPLRSDESSSLRERFKPALQCKGHAFE